MSEEIFKVEKPLSSKEETWVDRAFEVIVIVGGAAFILAIFMFVIVSINMHLENMGKAVDHFFPSETYEVTCSSGFAINEVMDEGKAVVMTCTDGVIVEKS